MYFVVSYLYLPEFLIISYQSLFDSFLPFWDLSYFPWEILNYFLVITVNPNLFLLLERFGIFLLLALFIIGSTISYNIIKINILGWFTSFKDFSQVGEVIPDLFVFCKCCFWMFWLNFAILKILLSFYRLLDWF